MVDSTNQDSISELSKALSKAQGEYKPLGKSKTAKVKGVTKAGKPYEYEYKYADLSDLIDSIKDAFSKNGLSFCQVINIKLLETWLMHSSGQKIVSQIEIPTADSPQALGSLLTYLRRYQLGAMVGIAAEEDDDGASAEAEKVNTPTKKRNDASSAFRGSPGPDESAKENAAQGESFVIPIGELKGKKIRAIGNDKLAEVLMKAEDYAQNIFTGGGAIPSEVTDTIENIKIALNLRHTQNDK